MYIGTIAKRYAKALWEYALECKAEDEVYQQMLNLFRSFMQVKELQQALVNPVIDRPAKLDLLRQASGGALHPVCERFVTLVFRQHREHYLLFITASFLAFYRHKKSIYVGSLTTAVPLDKPTEEHLYDLISKAVNGTVEFDTHVDDRLIGGFILQLDNRQMDASVRGQLQQIQAELMR